MLKAKHADEMIMALSSYEWGFVIIVVIGVAYLFYRSFSRRMEGKLRTPQTTTG